MSEAFLQRALSQPPNHKYAVEDDQSDQGDLQPEYLIAMVGILFDYLPTINRLRRTHILEMERMTPLDAEQKPQSTAVEAYKQSDSIGPSLAGETSPSADMSPMAQTIDPDYSQVPDPGSTMTPLRRENTTERFPSTGEQPRSSKDQDDAEIPTPVESISKMPPMASENEPNFDKSKNAQPISLTRESRTYLMHEFPYMPMVRFLQSDDTRSDFDPPTESQQSDSPSDAAKSSLPGKY